MRSDQFVFIGFLPNRSARRKKALKRLAEETATLVFFEAPHRLRAMLVDMQGVLGDRDVVMIREMTKVFEEGYRGRISSVLDQLTPETIRGEFTLVVRGANAAEREPLTEEISDRIARLVSERKGSLKDIASRLAQEEGLAFRQIYKACLAAKRQREGSKCERAC
jgi:16S rRNA (cytidine1402-2'-O)-methyltransferase